MRTTVLYGNPDSIPTGFEQTTVHERSEPVITPGHRNGSFVGYEPSVETIVRDRHIIKNRGTEKTGRPTNLGGGGFGPDPMKDGPAQPGYRMLNRTFRPQAGTDNTRNEDDLSRGFSAIGSQDGSSQIIWGGTPGLWQPYGSYAGLCVGPVQGIQGPGIGEPGDGRQIIPNSPPHGLHSDTVENTLQTNQRFAATPQQRPVRVDRPANSPIAGQSYSQTVQMQGQTSNPNNIGRIFRTGQVPSQEASSGGGLGGGVTGQPARQPLVAHPGRPLSPLGNTWRGM